MCKRGLGSVFRGPFFFGDALMFVSSLGNLLALRIKAKSMYRGFFIFLLCEQRK